jgi:hypothetical protein
MCGSGTEPQWSYGDGALSDGGGLTAPRRYPLRV